jgi:hypothetical protein
MQTKLAPESLRWIGVRFLDPSGRVFIHEGEFFRAIYPRRVQSVQQLFTDGIVDQLVGRGLVIPTTVSKLQVDGFPLVLHHRRAPFDVRPADWNRSLFRDAASVFVDLNLLLLKHGLCTVDAHGANFGQIGCCRPVWLDFGSIVPIQTGDEGVEEFRRCFINPLKLLSRPGNLGRLTRVLSRDGGVSDDEMAWLGGKSARLIAKGTALTREVRRRIARVTGVSVKKWRERLLIAARRDSDVTFPRLKTQWANYQQNSALPEGYEHLNNSRRETVLRLLRQLHPKRVIDLAGNEGFFSFMAARHGAETLCVDFDEGAVENFYVTARRCAEPLQITAGCADVMQPRERRHTGDFVIAMALTHHLSLTQRFPFAHIAANLASLTTDSLLTEFMPNGVGSHRIAPDPLPDWYRFEHFAATLQQHFKSVEEIEYDRDPKVSPRRMILCRHPKSS